MKQKTITLKKTTPTPMEAYAIKLCPPEVQPEGCVFGLPMFVRARVDAINESCIMLSHMNIRPEIARLCFLGRYDNIKGAFIAPKPAERYEANLADALAEVTKGASHEEK